MDAWLMEDAPSLNDTVCRNSFPGPHQNDISNLQLFNGNESLHPMIIMDGRFRLELHQGG